MSKEKVERSTETWNQFQDPYTLEGEKNEGTDETLGNTDNVEFFGNEKVTDGVLREKEEDLRSPEEQVNEVQARKIGSSVLGMLLRERKSEKMNPEKIRLTRRKFGRRLAYLDSLSARELNKAA